MANKKTIWASVLYLRKFADISKAIQLVSIAKLRKLSSALQERDYALAFCSELFSDVCSVDSLFVNNTFVVLTSEKSCCGKLNSAVLSVALDSIGICLDDNKCVNVISVGWKGRVRLSSKYKSELVYSISDSNNVSFFLSYVIALCIFSVEFDKCLIYFSKYYKIFEQVASVYEFCSFSIFFDYIFRSRKTNFFYDLLISNYILSFRHLYNYNVCLVIFDALEELRYSELGCRAFSMETAHRNSIELLREKVLIYNKLRQAGITTDLLEVVSGAIYTE